METVSVTHGLPDISQASPLSDADEPLVQDLIEVLEKHNALSRFGITLLHKHFDLKDGEILLEETDVKSRIQRIRVIKQSELFGKPYTATNWRLDSGEPIVGCVCGDYGSGHQHFPRP